MATPSTLLEESALARSQAGAAAGLHLLVMGPKQFATFALPARGEVVVGRGDAAGVDIKLEDEKASRRHLRLHIGDELEVEDLGSANGTRLRERKLAPGTRVRVLPGEAISIGALILMVQPNRSAPVRLRGRPLPPAEFEERVEWECTRAEAIGGRLSIARLPAPSETGPPEVAYGVIRIIDVVGRWGPDELTLLMPGLAREEARAVATAFAQLASSDGSSPRIALASYPDDGSNSAALLAKLRAREGRGVDTADDAARAWTIACVEPSMLRLQALTERAAAGNINVLILGESGTGKELLAQTIHQTSPRASRPLVAINCAALSASLIESELFGHERGAFTGAGQAKPGLLESAPGGTILLDEIGELPLPLQAKLLRVIEAREVLRVGAVRPRKIDVRFIAATNRELEAEVAEGRFRRDLYFRLNGVTLTIPPLRERPADIPILARGFLARCVRYGLRGDALSPEISGAAMAVLRAHGWPGNVRELRNCIERALVLCDGPLLLPEHFPKPVPLAVMDTDAPTEVPSWPSEAPGPPHDRARILAALAACGGNQSRAARQLGISRKVLIARLERYGVARPRKPGSSK